MKKWVVWLEAEERCRLEQQVRTGKAAVYRIRHANVLLAVDESEAGPGLPDEQAYLLARALHRAEGPLASRLEQAKESTAANIVAASPKPEMIHPGAQKYLREAGLLR